MDSSSSSSNISITREEYNAFYKFDRALLSRIVISLSGDVSMALQVMSFLIYLEKRNIGSNLIVDLVSLPESSIDALVDEVRTCMSCLSYEFFPTFVSTLRNTNDLSLPWIKRVTKENLTLGVIHVKREDILNKMTEYLTTICYPAFEDICVRFETLNKEDMYTFSQFLCGQHVTAGTRNVEGQHVSADDRTVFLIFSKGYPISKSEVHAYFTRRFGEIVEAINMANEGGRYATMVLRSAAKIPEIVNDGVDKTKFIINGKFVWAQKFIPNHKSVNYN
ncbi:unnamed protein product [Eruca vesicaria subsp. sativa]|uniref:Uncharacterized protein n=1 Tax=Eruca vesicaria subsp. sativa TaxID=29727 RepID=A0ABC8JKT1_ERUVS|nr:unnamed protein product [Eruca vesicaria subsp. sativa]